jgi:CheY-like chemotaxis protein
MVVEDEEDIRRLVRLSLERLGGWEVLDVGSGEEALLTAPGWHPDVVLLDVMMPGVDGPTVLQRLRGRPSTSTAQVIFLTARIQSAEVDRYLELGAAGVIAKPFDPVTLPKEIQKIVEQGKLRWASGDPS